MVLEKNCVSNRYNVSVGVTVFLYVILGQQCVPFGVNSNILFTVILRTIRRLLLKITVNPNGGGFSNNNGDFNYE